MLTAAQVAVPWTLKKLMNAKVIDKPFPHVEIDEIFEPNYYKHLLWHFPLIKNFKRENESVRRLDLLPDPAGGGSWPIESHVTHFDVFEFWDNFRTVFFNDAIRHEFLRLFRKQINNDNYFCGRLVVDGKNSGLGPHTDRFDKMISIIYHLPVPNCPIPSNTGTMLLEPKLKDMKITDEHYSYDEFDIVKYIDFKPNKMFAFEVMRNEGGVSSFHGYKQIEDYQRQTIKCFIQRKMDPAKVREEVEKTKHRSRRWRKELENG